MVGTKAHPHKSGADRSFGSSTMRMENPEAVGSGG
jgi:hypothetical protein